MQNKIYQSRTWYLQISTRNLTSKDTVLRKSFALNMLDLDSWPHTPHGVLLLTLLLGLPGEHAQEYNHTSCVKGKVLTQDPQGQVFRTKIYLPQKDRG